MSEGKLSASLQTQTQYVIEEPEFKDVVYNILTLVLRSALGL